MPVSQLPVSYSGVSLCNVLPCRHVINASNDRFQALKPLLIDARVYADRCSAGAKEPCAEQLLALDWLFTLGSSLTNLASLPLGIALDAFGPLFVTALGGSLFVCGCLAFGLFKLYVVGYALLALGGPCLFLGCLLPLVGLFPRSSGLVMASLTGAFDASSVVFWGFQGILARHPGLDIHTLFSLYALLPASLVGFLLPCLAFSSKPGSADLTVALPEGDAEAPSENSTIVAQEHSYHNAQESTTLDGSDILGTRETVPLLRSPRQTSPTSSLSLSKQLQSGAFLGMAMMMCIYMLRMNFYISSVHEQLEDLFERSLVSSSWTQVTDLDAYFNMALPAGGIVSIPMIGFLLDRYSFPVSVTIQVVSGITVGILRCVVVHWDYFDIYMYSQIGMTSHNSLIPFLPLQYITITLFVLLRPLVYALAGDYCSRTFGPLTFGRIYGTMNLLGGLFNLLQHPLISLALEHQGGHFGVSNGIILGLNVLSLGFPIYLVLSKRRALASASE